MPKTIQVYEHGCVQVGHGSLTMQEFDRLVVYNECHGGRFFSVGHRRIHFAQYVGVIQVGCTTIEILPKAGKASDADLAKWRGVLVDMLRRAGLLPLESLTDASLRLRHASLFDLYVEAFLRETRRLVHQGLVRKYRRTEGNLPVLKGQLMFREQLKRNLIHRERCYSRHQCYDRDNVFNAVLKTAIDIVVRTTPSPFLMQEAGALGLSFEGIGNQRITADTFRRILYDRNTACYRKALTLAELIILHHAPDVAHGRRDVLAILFDMNQLFESYVLRELKRAEPHFRDSALRVSGQRSKTFWRAPDMSKTIRADIVVDYADDGRRHRVVLDTKWKLPRDGRPGDADLRQMYAYSLQFGANATYLVYPRANATVSTVGRFMPAAGDITAQEPRCGLWFVDLFDGNQLNPRFGQRLCESVLDQGPACVSGAVCHPEEGIGPTLHES